MPARPSQWTETPDLYGEVVTLVPLRDHHTDGLIAAADDDEVFDWMPVARPRTPADVAAMLDTLDRGGCRAWAQIDQASGEVAGITTYYDVSPGTRSLAIGFTWLGRRWWRTGINRDAKRLLLHRAFDDLGAVRVVWHVDGRNTRSQTAVEALGATREGVLRKHKQRRDGSWRDTVQFAMTDDDWPEVRERLASR